MTLADIKIRGTRGPDYKSTGVDNNIRCVDGFKMSVIAGGGAYASPRDERGPYDAVEVGFPTVRPEPWAEWQVFAESPADPTQSVYGYVPIEMVEALVALHGGDR